MNKDIIIQKLRVELKQKDASFQQLRNELSELKQIVIQQAKKIDYQAVQITSQKSEIAKSG